MENKSYSTVSNLLSNNNTSTAITTTSPSSSFANTFVLSPSTNTPTTTTTTTTPLTSSLQSLQTISEENNRTNRILTQPVFNKLSSEIIKQERIDDDCDRVQYSIANTESISNRSIGNSIARLNSFESTPMSNVNSQLISSHLSNGAGPFFVSNVSNELTSNYKLPASSNSDLPSPSNSSNSSNPSSSTTNQIKRHGDGPDTTRKREVRLQKNRDAARECRRKKKEYIKCLEERVTGLETQNKALIEELRQLKELYCQREDSNSKLTTKR